MLVFFLLEKVHKFDYFIATEQHGKARCMSSQVRPLQRKTFNCLDVQALYQVYRGIAVMRKKSFSLDIMIDKSKELWQTVTIYLQAVYSFHNDQTVRIPLCTSYIHTSFMVVKKMIVDMHASTHRTHTHTHTDLHTYRLIYDNHQKIITIKHLQL